MRKFNKNTFIKILKSKELKILIYFIVVAIAFVVIDKVYSNYYIELYRYEGKYEWEGPDTNGDGEIGDVEGYGYLFGGFLKDIGGCFIDIVGELASGIKVGILLMPVIIKRYFLLICILIQIISIIVKEDKKVLNYMTIIMNLVSSVIAIFVSVFSNITLIQGMLIFDIIISSGLIYYNGKGTGKQKKQKK